MRAPRHVVIVESGRGFVSGTAAALLCLVGTRIASAAGPKAVDINIRREFDRLDGLTHLGCGQCIGVGGAWCTSKTGSPKCVPDAREMCSADPNDHAGMAGTGRCSEPTDFEWQAYYHAPRRPPVEPTEALRATSCESHCTTEALQAVVPAAMDGATTDAVTSIFSDCGSVVLSNAITPTVLHALRDMVVNRLDLATSAATAAGGKAAKYLLPGVRGNSRAEFVLPATAPFVDAVTGHILSPGVTGTLQAILSHPPSIEFASVMVSWPGAAAQSFHRDAGAGSEAALFLFVPLEAMAAVADGNGPPELCGCTHHPRAAVAETECPGPRMVADNNTAPVGSIVVYEPGLVHRGLSNRATADGGDRSEPRVMLHLVIAPQGARVRARPEGFLSTVAQSHVRRWRSVLLNGTSVGCDAYTAEGCRACLDGSAFAPFRTGCAWCDETATCVPDVAAMCGGGPRTHRGTSGLGGTSCPSSRESHRSDL